jgi:hypothetical protein
MLGKGPWQNAKGVIVAKSVEDLHSDSNNITKQTALTEKAETVSGRGDPVNVHDILTGSDPVLDCRRRHDVWQLDKKRRGLRDCRAP